MPTKATPPLNLLYARSLEAIDEWNLWRKKHPRVKPNLRGVSFQAAMLQGVDLHDAHLEKAFLREAHLYGADLRGADLRHAVMVGANLNKANLTGADLREAILASSSMNEGTIIENARFTGCRVYGVAAWSLVGTPKDQANLVITLDNEPQISVDNLEIAHFTHLLLNNAKIRNVIDTIGQKGVLILGRFIEERKVVLDEIRVALRKLGFLPMMFDFERPTQRDFTETIKILAGLSRFIIADITNPKSSPLELQATMPEYMIPFVPIIQESEEPFAMFRDLKQKYGDWVLDVLKYDTADNLVRVLEKAVVRPALEKGQELLSKKAEEIRFRHVKDFQ